MSQGWLEVFGLAIGSLTAGLLPLVVFDALRARLNLSFAAVAAGVVIGAFMYQFAASLPLLPLPRTADAFVVSLEILANRVRAPILETALAALAIISLSRDRRGAAIVGLGVALGVAAVRCEIDAWWLCGRLSQRWGSIAYDTAPYTEAAVRDTFANGASIGASAIAVGLRRAVPIVLIGYAWQKGRLAAATSAMLFIVACATIDELWPWPMAWTHAVHLRDRNLWIGLIICIGSVTVPIFLRPLAGKASRIAATLGGHPLVAIWRSQSRKAAR